MIDKAILMQLRTLLIQMLNTVDDALGMPRTIPTKSQRRYLRRLVDVSN